MGFRSLLHRVTGLSVPVFGIQWTPSVNERDVVRRVLTGFEDRRVLYAPLCLEVPDQVTHSVLGMRDALTQALQELPETSEAISALRAMRAACRKFLDAPRPEFPHILDRWPGSRDELNAAGFFVALGEMRATFGLYIAALAVRYGIDLEPELASILPEGDASGT